jgi:hypothetical protein
MNGLLEFGTKFLRGVLDSRKTYDILMYRSGVSSGFTRRQPECFSHSIRL